MSDMKMTMTVTPDSNVDREGRAVIDNSQIGTVSFNWDQRVDIQSVKDGSPDQKLVKNFSLFDDLIVVDGTPYRVLRALSE